MKLLIDEELIYTETLNPSITDDEYDQVSEYLSDVKELLDKFCVHHDIEQKESYFTITLEVQKVNLDELDMNTLFSYIVGIFKYKLRYASLGGEGCDFALAVTKEKS